MLLLYLHHEMTGTDFQEKTVEGGNDHNLRVKKEG